MAMPSRRLFGNETIANCVARYVIKFLFSTAGGALNALRLSWKVNFNAFYPVCDKKVFRFDFTMHLKRGHTADSKVFVAFNIPNAW